MSVKMYTLDELKSVHGLYPDKALSKMDGDMEIYSTLLDKFLNQTPRTIPKLKQLLKDGKMAEYADEMKSLRIDLADIFALGLYERANILYDTAEKGNTDLCKQQLEPFIQALQSFAYELKQCRTQDALENEGEAANKAAELDIGSSVVNNKYSTVNKAKFYDLYGRISSNMTDRAINLTNVLRAMGYDSEITKYLNNIMSDLSNMKLKSALTECERLLILLGCQVPESSGKKFLLLLADQSGLAERIGRILGSDVEIYNATGAVEFQNGLSGQPDFVLINSAFCGNGYTFAEQLRKIGDTSLGFLFTTPTSSDILKARGLGAVEFFILPLAEDVFANKMRKYIK